MTAGLRAAAVRASIVEGSDVELQGMVDLVARVTEAPVVAIAVLLDGVYHYDVCAGVDPFDNPVEKALCQVATGSPRLVEVPDTWEDPRTRGLAAVDGRDSEVRYYLSVPLVVGDREVGRFCVFDMRPRHLDRRQRETLEVLGRAAGRILDLRLLQRAGEVPAVPPRLSIPEPRSASDLVARAAHDLRSPLVTLGASLELLHDAVEPAAGSLPEMLLDKAGAAVVRMDDLLAGVLDLHDLGSGQVDEVDLDHVIDGVREDLGALLDVVGGQVVAGGLGVVHGNRGQLHSLFLNLVGNAVKFARPGVAPRVEVAREATRDGVLVTVTDNGIGIAADQRDNVFDLFTRLTGAKGHGIGLSTVARIVEVHGGRVGVADPPHQQGTQIRVWLPTS